jgi:integrase
MASARVKLDTRRADEYGNYPAKIIISNNQTNAAISLNCYLPKKAWVGDGLERPVKLSHPGAKIINDQIQSLYIEIRQKISELEMSGWTKNAKASEIKERILKDRYVAPVSKANFTSFAKGFISECKSYRTKEIYSNTLRQLKIFTSKEKLEFNEINHQFLRRFDDFLSNSCSGVNTRSIHFRNIRAIFNRAIDDEAISQELYPFRKFKIKHEEKEKVSLTAEQVKELHEYKFATPALRMARDYWMLSFFLCGINPVDLYNLKKPDGENRVSFVRTKMQGGSHNTIRLLIQPEAFKIIERHKNDENSPYLLNFVDKYNSYDIFKSFLAKKIRDIAGITGFKGLTMYWARYSWATIADSLEIPEKTISKGLGHVDKSMAGRKYITYDWSKVDRANEIVIRSVFS